MFSILFGLNAKNYVFESNNSNTVLNTIKYPDGKEYIHIENSGLWKDSNGDFGTEKCVGVIKKENKVKRCIQKIEYYV